MFREIDIDFLPKYKIDYLVQNTTNHKFKCAVLLMTDAGLRVSECIELQLSNFDFKERLLSVTSLKKRESARFKNRIIPITNRLYSALLNYIPKLPTNDANSWLFPNKENTNHMRRETINKYLNRFKKKHSGFDNLHPHALRHSYATILRSKGEPIEVLQRLLGHENREVTEIYAHIPTDHLKQIHSKVFDGNKTKLQRLKAKIFGEETQQIINIEPLQNELMVGRDDLIYQVNDKLSRNINQIILGDTGLGKSTILKNINLGDRKALYFDDCSEMKTTLLNTLLYLHESKEKVFELMFGEYDKSKLKTKLSRHSMKNLAQNICDVVEPHEYVLIIDSVDRIAPRAVDVLEQFKDHFTIICAAREVPLNKTSFLWNFETIKLEKLTRKSSLDLISKLSNNLDIEDYEQYKNYIWNKSDGNPRVITEMIERFRKEPVLSSEIVSKVDHYGSLPEIDMSIFVLIALASLAILRYYGRESGDTSLTFLGGCAMILLILSRYLFNFTKHKVLK